MRRHLLIDDCIDYSYAHQIDWLFSLLWKSRKLSKSSNLHRKPLKFKILLPFQSTPPKALVMRRIECGNNNIDALKRVANQQKTC